MPKKLEAALRKQAHRKGYKGDRANHYVYGTMNKIESKERKKRARSRARKRTRR